MLKGINSLTGTVHYAKVDSYGFLVQTCGIKANQTVYLSEPTTDVEITCRKCVAKPAKVERKPQERKEYGRQGYSITEIREMAKLLGIKGRTSKSGEELLKEITAKAPHIN